MTFIALEAEEKSRHRGMRWVSLEGKPSLEKMTSDDDCFTHIHGIVAGETPNVRDLSFSRSGLLSIWSASHPNWTLGKHFGRLRTSKGCP